MQDALNVYQDRRIETKGNFGVDIALQRADDLDQSAIQFLSQRSNSRALDAASASGGQAIRMAVAGAHVIALDMNDYSDIFKTLAKTAGVEDKCEFLTADLQTFSVSMQLGKFDAITLQRMIHYVTFKSAIAIVSDFARALKDDGVLYISASGIKSELGNGYLAKDDGIETRYGPLSTEMVKKHDINGFVCLYSEDDMAMLLKAAGLRVKALYSSPFGNVKAEAVK